MWPHGENGLSHHVKGMMNDLYVIVIKTKKLTD